MEKKLTVSQLAWSKFAQRTENLRPLDTKTVDPGKDKRNMKWKHSERASSSETSLCGLRNS